MLGGRHGPLLSRRPPPRRHMVGIRHRRRRLGTVPAMHPRTPRRTRRARVRDMDGRPGLTRQLSGPGYPPLPPSDTPAPRGHPGGPSPGASPLPCRSPRGACPSPPHWHRPEPRPTASPSVSPPLASTQAAAPPAASPRPGSRPVTLTNADAQRTMTLEHDEQHRATQPQRSAGEARPPVNADSVRLRRDKSAAQQRAR